MFRAPILDPSVGARPVEASFCGDHQPGRVGVQSFSDNLFTHAGAVGVRRVDEIDSSSTARCNTRIASGRLEGSPQIPSPVIRIAPNPRRFTRRSPPIENSPLLRTPSCASRFARHRLTAAPAARRLETKHRLTAAPAARRLETKRPHAAEVLIENGSEGLESS